MFGPFSHSHGLWQERNKNNQQCASACSARLKKQDLQWPCGSWTGQCSAGKGELWGLFGTRLTWGWKWLFVGFLLIRGMFLLAGRHRGKWRNQRPVVDTFWMVPVPKSSWEAPRWVIYLCSKQSPEPQHFALPAAKIQSVSGLISQNSTTVLFPF